MAPPILHTIQTVLSITDPACAKITRNCSCNIATFDVRQSIRAYKYILYVLESLHALLVVVLASMLFQCHVPKSLLSARTNGQSKRQTEHVIRGPCLPATHTSNNLFSLYTSNEC